MGQDVVSAVNNPLRNRTAATFVVNPTGADADFTDIASALAALPAAGGKIFLREGTYSIAATLALPDSDVEIEGSGFSSLIDIGANVIAAFTRAHDRRTTFKNLRINGGDVAGQAAFDYTLGASMFSTQRIENVWVSTITGGGGTQMEKIVRASGGVTFTQMVMTDCIFNTRAVAAASLFEKPTTGGELFMARVRSRGFGGFSRVRAYLTDCELLFSNPVTFDSSSFVENCFLGAGPGLVTVAGTLCRFTGVRFTNTSAPQVSVAAGFAQFSNCEWGGGAVTAISIVGGADDVTIEGGVFFNTAAPIIDIAAGCDNAVVAGCTFIAPSAEAIRTVASAGVFSGNRNCGVLETGAANANKYSQIDGAASTLLGATTEVWATAATVVVDQDGNGDVDTIAKALTRILAYGGGEIYIREGTYAISAALVLPAVPIKITGAGRGATIIDIGSNAISAFELATDQQVLIRDLSVKGDTAIDQTFFKITALFSQLNPKAIRFENVSIPEGSNTAEAIRTFVEVPAGVGRVTFAALNCVFGVGFTALSFLHEGTMDTDFVFTNVHLAGDLRIADHINNWAYYNALDSPVLLTTGIRPVGDWTIGTVRWSGVIVSSSTCTSFTITGTGSLGGTISDSTVALFTIGALTFPGSVRITGCTISAAGGMIFGDDSKVANSSILDPSVGGVTIQRRSRFANCEIQARPRTAGGGLGEDVQFSNCAFSPPTLLAAPALTIAAGDVECIIDDCHFSWQGAGGSGIETSANRVVISNCTFETGFVGLASISFLDGEDLLVEGCIFSHASTPRAIDIAAGADNGVISNCNFISFTAEAIRIAAGAWVVTGNKNCEVLETGASDSHTYTGNSGFAPSTIIGPSSRVETSKKAGVSAGATTGAFVNQFTHTNTKGLVGIGTIKNTGGVNALEVRENVTDAFGVTTSVTTAVLAGSDYMLDPQTNFSTARPPYVSYGVDVRHPVAATTFDLQFTGRGAD